MPCSKIAAVILAAVVTDVLGQQLYEGYSVKVKGSNLWGKVDTLEDCVNSCKLQDGCSAATYFCDKKLCYRSYCGHNVLKKECGATTVIFGKPVEAGYSLPAPSHDFVLTDRCGTHSYGKVDMKLGAIGVDYQVNVSDLLGKAAHFPGKSDGKVNFLRSAPHQSLKVFSSSDQSFTVAFNFIVNSATTKEITLVEFRGPKDGYSFHYWLSPNLARFYYNLVDIRIDDFAHSLQINKWNHVAIVYDAFSSSHYFYFNGNLTYQSYLTYSDRKAIEYITIGGRYNNPNNNYFDGSMYCVGLWTSALDMYQISEHRRSCVDGQVYVDDPNARSDKCEAQARWL